MHLFRTSNLDLQHPTLRVFLQQLQDGPKVLIRHHGVLGPHFQIIVLAAPVDLEFLDLLVCLLLVFAHELGAVRGRGERGGDLLVERFERWFGGCVEEDDLMAVGGRDREEERK